MKSLCGNLVLSATNFTLTKGLRSKRQIFNSLRWPIYITNSVNNTELPCYTLPPTQHLSLFRNLPLYDNKCGSPLSASETYLNIIFVRVKFILILHRQPVSSNSVNGMWFEARKNKLL